MKFGVLVFPGSNCDHDTHHVVDAIARQPVTYLWHASEDLQGCDAILVPGGFAYGDYLRTGAIAKFAPVMQSVAKFAKNGGLVLGICNGFQILCEAGLLTGRADAERQPELHLQTDVSANRDQSTLPLPTGSPKGSCLQMPIGHMEGNYFCDAETLTALKAEDRIAFRYATSGGEITTAANPNGSLENIAGVLNEGRNVLGMMPHPDRSSEALLGSADGLSAVPGHGGVAGSGALETIGGV